MNSTIKKTLFFVPTLSVVGGIERWLQTIIGTLPTETIEVLYAYDSPQEITLDNFRKTPDSLHEVITDNPFRKIQKLVYRARSLNRHCRQKNISTVLVSADGLIIATLLLKYFKRRDLQVVAVMHQEIKTLSRISQLLLRWLLPSADTVVAVSKGIETELQQYVAADRLRLIYNAITLTEIEKKVHESTVLWSPRNKHLVAIGRIESLKRYDHAIRAVAALPYKNVQLHIIGSGAERDTLQTLVEKQSMSQQVTFEGTLANVFPAIAAADALMVTSQFESFGVVMIEAMALGKPIIAYDCDFGPREILQSHLTSDQMYAITPYGYLVRNGDIGALSTVLERFVNGNDSFDPAVIQKRAAVFDMKNIKNQWEQLLI